MLGITPAQRQPLPDYSSNLGEPIERRWSPYSDNGGSTVAVAGEDFVIVASDTRLTNGGYGILSRNISKMFQLTDESVLAACGCWADVLTLTKLLNARIQVYKYTHNRTMKTPSISQMLANTLYSKRFFPYSVRNILAGLDEEGNDISELHLQLYIALNTLFCALSNFAFPNFKTFRSGSCIWL